MKLTIGLLLSLSASTVCAAAEEAGVYFFQKGVWPNSAKPSVLSAEETRLIIAQRLGVTQYHSINDANWIADINKFGGSQDEAEDKVPEMVLIVEGVTMQTALPFAKTFMSIEAAFKVASPPASSWTQKLVTDLQKQIGSSSEACPIEEDINPYNTRCWNGKSKIVRMDLKNKSPAVQDLRKIKDRLMEWANNGEMNLAVIFMPESCRSVRSFINPYGTYSMPSQVQLERRDLAEEPMTNVPAASSPAPPQSPASLASNDSDPIRGVVPTCFKSLSSCNEKTRNCSGHGSCFKKSGTDESGCYACKCGSTRRNFTVGDNKREAFTLDYWGGAACQKEDVSGPFWLLVVFSVVMIGLVTWAISMLFSIGEEKLPGVIGAGVSSKAR